MPDALLNGPPRGFGLAKALRLAWPAARSAAGLVRRRAGALQTRAVRAVASPRTAAAIGGLAYALARRTRIPGAILPDVRSVLVIRLDQIGDVVLTSPFLRELRNGLPQAWIGLVTNPGAHNLVELCPYVDEVITYDYRAKGRFADLILHVRALRLARSRLWGRRVDLALLPRWDVDSYHGAFLAYFSGAARRVAYSEAVTPGKRVANRGMDRLLTDPIGTEPSAPAVRHEVLRNLDVLCSLGLPVVDDRLEVWLDDHDREVARALLALPKVSSPGPLVAVALGASVPRKVWPPNRFGAVAKRLRDAYAARVVLLGGPGEESLGEQAEAECGGGVLNLVGKTSLRQCAAVLERCHLFIGNDSGPMHIAAAVGTPVVEVLCHPLGGAQEHPNSPLRFGPWGVPHRIMRPCASAPSCNAACTAREAHCIRGVTVEEVEAAAVALLEKAVGASGRHAGSQGGW